MAAAEALLDSNVIIAMVAEDHEHYLPSVALLPARSGRRFAVAAHSYAEAFTTLTRRNASATFRWSADDAWSALASVAAATALVGLSPAQTLDAVRSYARDGGTGPRLYDRLIGEAAVQHGIPRLISWNVGHMTALFPALEVCDPAAVLRRE